MEDARQLLDKAGQEDEVLRRQSEGVHLERALRLRQPRDARLEGRAALVDDARHGGDAPDGNGQKWLILDGDLDANWIENMNSVMDDNKLLTLASNERIKVLPHMRLIFEIRDLAYASPATVTRAGVLFISRSGQWKNFVESWIQNRERTSLRRWRPR